MAARQPGTAQDGRMPWAVYTKQWPLTAPHSRRCPCFACGLVRQERGYRPLPTTLELIARRRSR